MSEYQFYEFAAIDKPVTEEEAPYPWSVSSRAEVTPWRWRNVYNWGDFHGSVEKMMAFYDAHVYLANWGAFNVVLAFPGDLLSDQDVQPYLIDEWLEVEERAGRTILTWALAGEESDGDWADGDGILDRLLSIREELLRGDWRALYLGWLARWSGWGDVAEDEYEEAQFMPEPPVPPGLGNLTPAQRELAERLEVDPDLLSAAAELDVPLPDHNRALRDAVGALSPEEMTACLLRVASGEGTRVSAELNRRTRDHCQTGGTTRRSLGRLWESARRQREQRLRREDEAKERRQREQEAKRKARLQLLMKRADAAWGEADSLAQHKGKTSYDQAAERVRELRDAYALAERDDEYQKCLRGFRDRHGRRPALIRRIADL